jgi:hypothetical protein
MNRNMIFHYFPGELKKVRDLRGAVSIGNTCCPQNVNLMLAFTPPAEIKLSAEQKVVAWLVANYHHLKHALRVTGKSSRCAPSLGRRP